MSKILCVDDDTNILELIKINLELLGHEVITAENARIAYAQAVQEIPDLFILDVMMGEVNGFTLAQRLRNNPVFEETPILMLTALGMIEDKAKGFDAGADDYLVKPFELEELKMRVRALLKRGHSLPQSLVKPELTTVGDIILDQDNLLLIIKDKNVKLTPIEFDIVNILLQHYGQTVNSAKFLKDIWGYNEDDEAVETIRVHIRHLRTKIAKIAPKDKKYIETVYGGGYKLNPEG